MGTGAVSNIETLMIIFIGVTAVAVVIQMGVLVALFTTVKKSSARMEALAQQVESRLVPTLEMTQNMLQEYRPKVDTVISNLAETSTAVKQQLERLAPTLDMAQNMLQEYRPKVDLVVSNVAESSTAVKQQLERLDATLSDVVDRTRLQIIRVDELLSRTLDRVENTTEVVQRSLASPVRQASGVIQGVTAGLATFFHQGQAAKAKRPPGAPKDEWFI